jgi:hypothetical protein
VAYELGPVHPAFGRPLRVPLTESQVERGEIKVGACHCVGWVRAFHCVGWVRACVRASVHVRMFQWPGELVRRGSTCCWLCGHCGPAHHACFLTPKGPSLMPQELDSHCIHILMHACRCTLVLIVNCAFRGVRVCVCVRACVCACVCVSVCLCVCVFTQVTVEYSTTADGAAAQWLEPSQTAGKQHPYLFTQCQAIHARSLLPCQDTPQAKVTYDARVTAPAQLTVLMSALGNGADPVAVDEDAGTRTFAFDQPVAMAT